MPARRPSKPAKSAAAGAASMSSASSAPAVSSVKAPISKTAVLYFGHLPEGFFERQMKDFLSQFGAVAKVRLSRSRRTGGSRGYAFVQFMDQAVADVVQTTMHGYILMGKTLVCQHVPPEVWCLYIVFPLLISYKE